MGKSRSNKGGRDVLTPTPSLAFRLPRPTSPLTLFEDRRLHHPEQAQRPALSFRGAKHTLSVTTNTPKKIIGRFGDRSQTKGTVIFSAPKSVLVCVRRKTRKEVLHAFKKTGRAGQKKPRRNWLSSISCKRG